MKTLDAIAVAHGTDKATQFTRTFAKPKGYTLHFENFFEPLRDKPIHLLEIGIGGGESARTWLEYFEAATIHGVDIVHSTNPFNTETPNAHERYRFTAGDATSSQFWSAYRHGLEFDVIIDDGSHMAKDVLATFDLLWPHLKHGGLFAIEDLACSYSAIFQTPHGPTPMERLHAMLDQMHTADSDVHSITFSKELAILRKR